jgi:FtsZ-binding cell division protein ZapB
MIKAIQELKMKNEELQAENENLKLKIDEIIRVVNELKHNQSDIKEVKLGDNGR